jgi:hypothetical protein
MTILGVKEAFDGAWCPAILNNLKNFLLRSGALERSIERPPRPEFTSHTKATAFADNLTIPTYGQTTSEAEAYTNSKLAKL